MSHHADNNTLLTDLAEHPAVRAWAALCPARVQPQRIDILKGRKQTARRSTYRLVGVGPDGSDVIAKRYQQAKALLERSIYEQVLPRLPVPTVRYYGYVNAADGVSGWVFLEDIGNERYSPLVEEHRRLAGQWLGLFHTAGAHVGRLRGLPELGPDYYRQHVCAACRRLVISLENPALGEADRDVLGSLLHGCEQLASGWEKIQSACDRMPRTLVHGDFAAKNIHIRYGAGGGAGGGVGSGLALLPFDWGQAGWGMPAIDLVQYPATRRGFTANADLATYGSVLGTR
jgi:hypothetical protein